MTGAEFKAWWLKSGLQREAVAAALGVSVFTLNRMFLRAKLSRLTELALAQLGFPNLKTENLSQVSAASARG